MSSDLRSSLWLPRYVLSIVDRFLKSKLVQPLSPVAEDQAVLVYVKSEDFDGMMPIHDKLWALLDNSSIGMFDGNEIGGGETVLFLYGPDAELLFTKIEPVLRADEFCKEARVVIRWGGPNAPQREVNL
jgi:hypothetical protein